MTRENLVNSTWVYKIEADSICPVCSRASSSAAGSYELEDGTVITEDSVDCSGGTLFSTYGKALFEIRKKYIR